MNETLSRIVADLLVKAKAGEELSSGIHRLRDELKKFIESDDTISGKVRRLAVSFQEIIPDEKQRYNASITALSTTSKLSRQEIVTAITNQLDELKILEKVLMPAAPGDEFKAMEAKLQEMRAEISKLREKTVQLENEEKAIVNGMTARGKSVELVQKGMREVFATIAEEINLIKNKVDEFTTESATAHPIPRQPVQPQPVQPQSVLQQPAQQQSQDTEYQRKCPMCGGRMDLHVNTWICYSCAYEELKKDEAKGKTEEKSEYTNQPVALRDLPESAVPGEKKEGDEQKSERGVPSAPQDTEWQKKCPMCGGQMHFQISGEILLCYSCAYEEKKGEVQSKSEEKSDQTNAPERAAASPPPFAVPLVALPSEEFKEPGKQSSLSNNQLVTKKKPCPVCRKKMNWYPMEKAWRCPSCHYERRI